MSENLIIRKATLNDANRIEAIARQQWAVIYQEYRNRIGDELFEINFPNALDRKATAVIKALETGRCFVAEVDGVVAGFAFYNVNESAKSGEICNNGVDSDYKGRGIAGKLYNAIFEEIKALGCIAVKVSTGLDDAHAPARRAYEKAGFSLNLPTIMYYMKDYYRGKKEWQQTAEKIVVREARPEDFDRVIEIALQQWAIIYDGYKSRIGDELFNINFPDALKKKEIAIRATLEAGNRTFVTEVDGVVAGFAQFRVNKDNNVGVVGHNGVDNFYKGRGIAGRQYERIYERFHEYGCVAAVVHTGLDDAHAPARRAYEKSGFSANLPSIDYFKMFE